MTLIKRSFTLYVLPLKQDELHHVIFDRYLYKLLFKISDIDSAICSDNLLHHKAVPASFYEAPHDGFEKIPKVLEANKTEKGGKVKDCVLAGQNERVFVI